MVKERAHDFDEAINLTGCGCYNIFLLVTLSMTFFSMCMDLFGFSVVVQLASCDLKLDMSQKSILLSVPFLSTIISAYAWGYISDTRGRKWSLMIGLLVGYTMSSLSAFSPNWIVLGVLRCIGTCFSCCAQSVPYAMLGESCPEKIKGKHLIILSSSVQQIMPAYFCLSYFIGNLNFVYDLSYITFLPWRLLTIALCAPMGISAVLLMFVYESPKYLLNARRHMEALDVLKKMHKWNNRNGEEFPVHKLICEEINKDTSEMKFLQSLQEQTTPLFTRPLLFNNVLLFYYMIIIFGIPGSLFIWAPFLSNAVTDGSSADFEHGLCSVINQNSTISDSTGSSCEVIDLSTLIVSLITFNIYQAITFITSTFASRRKLLIVIILTTSGCSCCLAVLIPHKVSGIIYFGIFSASIAIGPAFSYYVDLFPTSVRGMAICLAMMVARISNIIAVNLVGTYVTSSHCTTTFYCLAVFLFIGVTLTILLPPDKKKEGQK